MLSLFTTEKGRSLVETKKDKQLNPGLYLGVRCTVRNFKFTAPKLESSTCKTIEELFDSYCEPKKKSPVNKNKSDGIKTTRFSGWAPVISGTNSDAIRLLPTILQESGCHCNEAATAVATFKINASEILNQYAETEREVDSQLTALINEFACVVTELKVLALKVSNQSFPNSKYDKNTGLWYLEKVLRKLFTTETVSQTFLISIRDELLDPKSSMKFRAKAIVRKNVSSNDKVSIQIVTKTTDPDDSALLNAVARMRKSLASKKLE